MTNPNPMTDDPRAQTCQICRKPQPCPLHGRTPVTDADFDELRRDVANDDLLAVVPPPPQELKKVEDTHTRVLGQPDSPLPVTTAGTNEATPTMDWLQQRFVPKRACEGAQTLDRNRMCECPHPQCRIRVADDLVDHAFFGFKASCPLKAQSPAVGRASLIGEQVTISAPENINQPLDPPSPAPRQTADETGWQPIESDDRTADELTAARAHPHCPDCRLVLEDCRCQPTLPTPREDR